jgi:hypothetical protein
MFDKENIAIMEEQLDAINSSANRLPSDQSMSDSDNKPRVFSEIQNVLNAKPHEPIYHTCRGVSMGSA